MINCPHCQSENVQRYVMVYEAGVAEINTSFSGASAGGAGLNLGGGSSTGTSQTALSKRTAPPQKDSYIAPFIIGFIVDMILTFATSWSSAIADLAALGIGGVMLFRAIRFNIFKWPGLMEEWGKSFICLKCGHSFIPDN